MTAPPARRSTAAITPGHLVAAVSLSRVIAYGAGIVSALTVSRVAGWPGIDPLRLTQSFGRVGNVLVAPVLRWDGVGYLNIAEHGYRTAGETILFPFYPLLIAGLGRLIDSYVVAGLLISIVGFAVGLLLLHRLCQLELGRRAADATVLLLAFAPLSFFFTAIYTESLFLALSVGAIYAARRERWAWAGILAALASVTRVTGILLLAPIALWQWRRYHGPSRQLAWLLAAPAALVALGAYMSAEGYGWLAPLRNQHAHHFAGPQATVVAAVRAAWHGVTATAGGLPPLSRSLDGPFSLPFDSIVLLVVFVLALIVLVLTFRRLDLGYGLYAALALLVTIASQTKIQPLEGIDRYTLTIFPLWMAAGAWLAERRAVRPVVLVGACLLGFYAFEFATWAFIA